MQRLQRFLCSLSNIPLYCGRTSIVNERKSFAIAGTLCRYKQSLSKQDEEFDWESKHDNEYRQVRDEYIGKLPGVQRVCVLQPYVKWGVNKKRNTTPELQLAEAVTLANTLSNWVVVMKKCIPRPDRSLFGPGQLEDLKKEVQRSNATTIFVSVNLLRFPQLTQLKEAFGLPVYDRYSLVIHIFRQHAKSPEARLQVALAELPYINKRLHEQAELVGRYVKLDEKKKEVLHSRERKLKKALSKLEEHRKLIKRQRTNYGFPTISVVGYTNAGKTSLIKALTGDASLNPENKLFATLDTTVHKGILPCHLEVLYVDTIGFIQDVPETLIKPFLVTLEDAITADVIVHVFDVSHPDMRAQVDHVLKVVPNLLQGDKTIINVANKCDIGDKSLIPEDAIAVSATNLTGIDILRMTLEKAVLSATGRKPVRIRVRYGSASVSWLYKETTVINEEPDPKDSQYLLLDVITTDVVLNKFRSFLQK